MAGPTVKGPSSWTLNTLNYKKSNNLFSIDLRTKCHQNIQCHLIKNTYLVENISYKNNSVEESYFPKRTTAHFGCYPTEDGLWIGNLATSLLVNWQMNTFFLGWYWPSVFITEKMYLDGGHVLIYGRKYSCICHSTFQKCSHSISNLTIINHKRHHILLVSIS